MASIAPMEATEYERIVRSHVEAALKRPGNSIKGMRLDSVVLEPRQFSPSTRLVVYLIRDDDRGLRFAYWTPIWEQVAWQEAHWDEVNIRSEPIKLAAQIVTQMFIDLAPPDPRGSPVDPDVHWVRASLVW